MNAKELIVRIRIEEDNKSFDKRMSSHTTIKANVIKHDQPSRFKPKTVMD